MSYPSHKKVEPFLKWAGGKRWLVKNHQDIFPKKFNKYIEPFLGSGAVFFHLEPKNALLADVNQDLINTYLAVRDDHEKVERLLRSYQKLHCKDFYYEMRARKCRTVSTKAAQFLYLNRTCWNGLYRVNLKGQFNVPIGSKNNVLLDSDDFASISQSLRGVNICVQDFESTIDEAQDGDFVFIDPPYTVKHNNNGFVKYNETLFSWDDQIRLRNAVHRARDRGAIVVVTNADHDSIKELYSGNAMNAYERSSVISGVSEKRGRYSELIINIGK